MTVSRIPSPSAKLPANPSTPEPDYAPEDYVDATPYTRPYCTAQLDDDPVFPTRCAEWPGHLGDHRSSSHGGVGRVSWENAGEGVA